MQQLVLHVAGRAPAPTLEHRQVSGEEMSELSALASDCQLTLAMEALVGDEPKLATAALHLSVHSCKFLTSLAQEEGPLDPLRSLDTLAALLKVGEAPAWQSLQEFRPNVSVECSWRDIERLMRHVLSRLLPDLDTLLFDAAAGHLLQWQWEEHLVSVLNSVHMALRTGATRLTSDWAPPDDPMDRLLLAVLVADRGRFILIARQLLLEPLQLRLLAASPERAAAVAVCVKHFAALMSSVLHGDCSDLWHEHTIADAIEREFGGVDLDALRKLVGKVLGHCQCGDCEGSCDCLVLSQSEGPTLEYSRFWSQRFHNGRAVPVQCSGRVFAWLQGLQLALHFLEHFDHPRAPECSWWDQVLHQLSMVGSGLHGTRIALSRWGDNIFQ